MISVSNQFQRILQFALLQKYGLCRCSHGFIIIALLFLQVILIETQGLLFKRDLFRPRKLLFKSMFTEPKPFTVLPGGTANPEGEL